MSASLTFTSNYLWGAEVKGQRSQQPNHRARRPGAKWNNTAHRRWGVSKLFLWSGIFYIYIFIILEYFILCEWLWRFLTVSEMRNMNFFPWNAVRRGQFGTTGAFRRLSCWQNLIKLWWLMWVSGIKSFLLNSQRPCSFPSKPRMKPHSCCTFGSALSPIFLQNPVQFESHSMMGKVWYLQ